MTADEILELARAGDLERLGEQLDAVAEAVETLTDAGQAEAALELVALTWRVWNAHGELAAGGAAARAALEAPGAEAATTWRARALYADGVLAFRAGDQDRSRARNHEALEVAREAGDVRGECDALTGLARVALRDGAYAEVVSLAREARERAQTAGDRAAEAAPLHLEAAGVRLQGGYAQALELYLESLALNEELASSTWVTMEHHNLGWVKLHLGDLDGAEAHFAVHRAASTNDVYGEAIGELNRAGLAAARGDLDEARRRHDAATAALERAGVVLDPDDESELRWLREKLEA